MKLYRAKIPTIAKETIDLLVEDGDIEVASDNRDEAERDLVAIMEEYVRRDSEFRNAIKDEMARKKIPYDQYGRTRSRIAEQTGHPLGDDVERFITRQIIENLLISPFVDEVYAEDKDIHKKVITILREHHVDEGEIREAAQSRIKNVREGTVEWEVALQGAMREVKKRRGLL